MRRVPGAHAHRVAPAVVLWSLDRTGPCRRAIAALDEGEGRRVARVDTSAAVHLTFEPVDREVLGPELPQTEMDLDAKLAARRDTGRIRRVERDRRELHGIPGDARLRWIGGQLSPASFSVLRL